MDRDVLTETLTDFGMSGVFYAVSELRAPWGMFLEIVSMDGPLGAERAGQPAQWSPVTGR